MTIDLDVGTKDMFSASWRMVVSDADNTDRHGKPFIVR